MSDGGLTLTDVRDAIDEAMAARVTDGDEGRATADPMYDTADEQYDLRREAMAQEPTKRIEMDMSSDERSQLETTYEQVHSVELGQTAKGDTQIKSVKVYALKPLVAAEEALEVFRWLRGEIKEGSYDPSS